MPIAIGRCYIFHSTNGAPQLNVFTRWLSLQCVTIAPDPPGRIMSYGDPVYY